MTRPVALAFSGRFDGSPLAIDGKIGPLGNNPAMGVLPVDLTLELDDSKRDDLKPFVGRPRDCCVGFCPLERSAWSRKGAGNFGTIPVYKLQSD